MSQTSRKANAITSPFVGIGDSIKVRGKLALLGWASVAEWARAHGYDQQIVRWTITQWGNRTDRRPHGGLSRQVLRDLRATLDQQKTPAMHEAELAAAMGEELSQV